MMAAWEIPPENPRVSPELVHVWRILITPDVPVPSTLWGVLSGDERVRSKRFFRPEDRAKFIRTRGTLRRVLGRYLSIPACEVELRYSATGKPSLADAVDLQFNVSHSGSVALLAVSGCVVGIDVELIQSESDFEEVANTYFSASERAFIHKGEATGRAERFFKLWTRKEALLKATGAGLTGLDSEICAEGWIITALDPAPGYAAALAHKCKRLEFLQWLDNTSLIG